MNEPMYKLGLRPSLGRRRPLKPKEHQREAVDFLGACFSGWLSVAKTGESDCVPFRPLTATLIDVAKGEHSATNKGEHANRHLTTHGEGGDGCWLCDVEWWNHSGVQMYSPDGWWTEIKRGRCTDVFTRWMVYKNQTRAVHRCIHRMDGEQKLN